MAASILYSDIGKEFYTKLGWNPFPTCHIETETSTHTKRDREIRYIKTAILAGLCEKDQSIAIQHLQEQSTSQTRFMIVPDLDHMLWHLAKEKFVCKKLLGMIADNKGTIIGEPGKEFGPFGPIGFRDPYTTQPPTTQNSMLWG